ncbi:STAS domain-containing protein [Actinomadura luteofluorescens]|uniref:Anti-sigma factor antagonist n=1 Tax=Actinomadura luteofluorescens TaxID=46163 RepID=A0A7Y9EC98_9ACTN|nr:STAS domain-containing protein [Actinomadura luteofluorescens]NYD45063.1 anti-sigma B factor antagonist [Actinomadura luteofluorescens]
MTDHTFTVSLPSEGAEVPVLRVAGDLDYHTAPRLREALDALPLASGGGAVLDVTELNYCDSTGITVLIAGYRRAQAAQSRIVLAGLNPDLTRVFEITGLDQVFAFHPTADEAVKSLGER